MALGFCGCWALRFCLWFYGSTVVEFQGFRVVGFSALHLSGFRLLISSAILVV